MLELWGNWCSLTLPVLITLERLLAVYYPFHFPLLVTPFRTWTAVFVFYIMWLPINVYYFFLENLDLESTSNGVVGRIVSTSLLSDKPYKDIYQNVKHAAIILSEPIPVVLVVIGCTMVGIRVYIAHNNRTNMSAVPAFQRTRVAPTFRTTWTLMLVCLVYTITIGTAFTLQLFVGTDWDTNNSIVIKATVRFVKCIHSSCNFLIYIYNNKNFKNTYRSIFGSWVRRHGHG